MPSAPSMPSVPPVDIAQVPTQAELDAEAQANAKKANKVRRSSSPGTILTEGMYGSGLPPVGRKTLLSGVA